MTNPKIVIVDGLTGEEVERPMNATELKDWQKYQDEQEKFQEETLNKVAAKKSALEKLEALGLNINDLKALGLG